MEPSETTTDKPDPGALPELARRFQSAVASGDDGAAIQLAARYVKVLESAWNRMSDSQRAGSPLPVQARDLFLWARESALIRRTLMADQLRNLQKTGRYCEPPAPFLPGGGLVL